MTLVFLELDKWDCMKLEGFYTAQEIISRVEDTVDIMLENVLAIHPRRY